MEESFAELFKKDDRQQQHLKPGQKVAATVTGIGKEYVFLDVGTKGDGSVELKEFLDQEGNPTIRQGDRVDVYSWEACAGNCSSPPGWPAAARPGNTCRRPF